MPVTQDRRARDRLGRIASKTICGRRHCSHCSRWLLITEFGVERWADASKTEVSHLKRDCRSCRSRQAREGRQRHEGQRRSNIEACRRWRRAQKVKRAQDAGLCAWCCHHPRGTHTSICETCDDQAYGWVQLAGGAFVEEVELASMGFDHGITGAARSSPLGLALTR